MTIAIGLLTDEVVVLAADTEETTESHKAEVSKFIVSYSAGTQMIIAGAGPDCHIETMAEILQEAIKKSKGKDDEELKATFRTLLVAYYRQHVLSWPTIPEREDNDFALLIALVRAPKRGKHKLWVTRQTTLREAPYYAAVGLGVSYAKVLLRERFEFQRWEEAIPIAIDVIRRVKRNVAGCGQQTELLIHTGSSDSFQKFPVPQTIENLLLEHDHNTIWQFGRIVSTPLDEDWEVGDKEIDRLPKEVRELRTKVNAWLEPLLRDVKKEIKGRRRRRRSYEVPD